MEFYTQNKLTRPIRLSDKTRRFAYDSLNRKYGLDTLKTDCILLDGIEGFEELSEIEKYDCAILKIAQESPVRICENEKLSGAATLGMAIQHLVPASYKGEAVCKSISHLTADFETVVKKGVNYIKDNAIRSLEKYSGSEKEAFAKSCLSCIEAFEIWHGRYLTELEKMPEYRDNYENLKRVPFEKAESFYEAVQSIWFSFAFMRLCGNWPGIGRIDYILGDYLKKDLTEKKITLDEAREILAHFFIKGCEWVNGQYIGSGDAQHYQNILLCGVDEYNNEITNEVTYLVLDILEELGISDFPTTVRVNKNTDASLLRRVAEVMRYGGGMLAIYNEDLIIDTLIQNGYPEAEARKFANDGCWEVQIPGKTFFSYTSFDSLQALQKGTLKGYQENLEFNDFEELYTEYLKDLRHEVEGVFHTGINRLTPSDAPMTEWDWKKNHPCTVISLFVQDCVKKGLSYLEGGPCYNVISPHIGGFADTVNSLYAIKKVVFDEKKLSFSDFMSVLKSNWEGQEILRKQILEKYLYYGNDNDEVDSIASRLLSDFADICEEYNKTSRFIFISGVSTFGRQLAWASRRLASPHGRKAGEVLAANCSPTPGTDKEGVTASIKSYCKADLSKLACGSALDIKILPTTVEGEGGISCLASIISAFVSLGGFFMQPDVVDASILREAQKHPENYSTLSVRVSGWNARFVTLNKGWQDMIIKQNEK